MSVVLITFCLFMFVVINLNIFGVVDASFIESLKPVILVVADVAMLWGFYMLFEYYRR